MDISDKKVLDTQFTWNPAVHPIHWYFGAKVSCAGNVSITITDEQSENDMEVQKQSKSERSTAVIILNSSLVKGELHQKLEANPFFRVRGKYSLVVA